MTQGVRADQGSEPKSWPSPHSTIFTMLSAMHVVRRTTKKGMLKQNTDFYNLSQCAKHTSVSSSHWGNISSHYIVEAHCHVVELEMGEFVSNSPISNLIPYHIILHYTLTVVSCNLLPPPTAVSTRSKRAHWCNSHFIHCTTIEVGDGVWGCTRARHWASGVRGSSPSPVLHRVTSDHLTRSQCWAAPSDSDLACFIQCHHWYTSISGRRYICSRMWWNSDNNQL